MKFFTHLILIVLFLPFVSFAQTPNPVFNWVQQEISPDNTLKKMTVSGSKAIIAGYGNSLFKSTDNGNSWSAVNLFNPEYNLLDLSIKGNVGYMAGSREKLYDASPNVYANGIILATTDGGASWKNIDLSKLGTGDDPALNPNTTLGYGWDFGAVETINDSIAYCALRWFEYGGSDHSGIFKTADSAKTWTNISGDLQGAVVTAITAAGNDVYIGGNKLLYKTTPESNELTDIFSSLNSNGKGYVTDITAAGDTEVYITTTANGVYYTNDGSTFSKFGTLTGGWDIYKVNDSTLVVGGSKNKSYVSTDKGITWNTLGITTPIWEVPGIVNDSLWLLADTTIYKIAVSGLTTGNYNMITQTVGKDNLMKAYINGNHVIVTGNDLSFAVSNDAGISWTNGETPEIPAFTDFLKEIDYNGLSSIGDTSYLCFNRIKFVDYETANDIYWSGGIFYTEDNWETFQSLDVSKIGSADADDPAKNPNYKDCNGVNISLVKYLGNGVVLAAVNWYDLQDKHSGIFRSADNGSNWTMITDDFGANYVQDIEVLGDIMYIAGNKILLKSEDGGETFTDIYANLDEDSDDAMFINAVRLGEDNKVFIVTSTDGIYLSNDGGATFTATSSATGSNDFYQLDKNSYIFMGTTSKTMFTNDGGVNWVDCSPGATIFGIGGIYNDKLYALGKGSVYTVNISDLDISTSVKPVISNNELSILYKNASVELVSSGSNIDCCRIYSITGKLVRTTKPASASCEFFNSSFSPGIYIISSEAGGKTYMNKVVFK